jgi:hypothetical protein
MLGVGCTIGPDYVANPTFRVPGAVHCNIRPSDFPAWEETNARNFLGTPGNLIRAREWNHVALTFDPRTWETVIYVNGGAAASRVLEGNFTPITKGRLYLGQHSPEFNQGTTFVGFKGSMDHVEVFDGPLGAAAIRDMYQSLAPR